MTITKKGQKPMSKERLVELIEKARVLEYLDILSGDPDVIVDMPKGDEYIADYLLANGVIVPLCKVGDTVYQTDGVRIYELEILDVLLHKNKPYYETESIDFDNDAIGKSIFLTREEAEAKLKEKKDYE